MIIPTSTLKSRNTGESWILSGQAEQGLGPREKGTGKRAKLGMVGIAVTGDGGPDVVLRDTRVVSMKFGDTRSHAISRVFQVAKEFGAVSSSSIRLIPNPR